MKKQNKAVIITLIIVAGLISLALILTNNSSTQNTIQVNGQATIDVTPDIVSIYFNVQTKGNTSKEAEDKNSEIVKELKNNIEKINISKNELKTQNFNIYPEYDYEDGERKEKGYRATHSLKIEISSNKTDLIGDLINAGTEAGAGINYINFELSPSLEQEAKSQAIQLASQDAKIKAESLAKGFDKNLGKLIRVSLNEFNYQPWRLYAESDGAIAKKAESLTQITPSEKEVSAYVSAEYKI